MFPALLATLFFAFSVLFARRSIVLSIVATTPLVAMFLTFIGEGIRPTRRAIFGSVLAVAGVILLVRNA